MLNSRERYKKTEDPDQSSKDENHKIWDEKYTKGIHGRLNIAESKVNPPKDIAIDTI